MQILIERDGGATKVAKEVADMEEAKSYEALGFTVTVVDAPEVPSEPAAKPKKPTRQQAA
jgi:hypothetical protein